MQRPADAFEDNGDLTEDWADAVDKINMLDYGDAKIDADGNLPSGLNDLIDFKIKDMNNNKWIIFRSFINGINDSPSSEWSEKSYIGRPDKVHIYTGAKRTINFSLKIMAFSLAEMKPLWKKLNYLIGLQYPHLTEEINPKMIAPFIRLTLGSILKNTPGFISSLTVTYPDDVNWELGKYTDPKLVDYNVQLPMGIDVTIDFTVIPDTLLSATSQHIFGAPATWFEGDN